MADRLADRVVLVTGGTGALGRVVTQRFLDEGCTVITTYLDSDEFTALKAESGDHDRLTGFKVDVTAEEQVEDLVDTVTERHGRIDILLNLVGAWKGGKALHDVGEDTWDTMLDVNLRSVFLVSKHVIPHMRDHEFGRIVSIGSKTGHDLPAESGPYAIAKHGVEAVTTILAKENNAHNITVNCVLPSVIDTPANREAMGAENTDNWVSRDAVADTILDLVRDPVRTGESVPVYSD